MSLKKACDRCGVEPVFPNRIITDSCGHKKCKRCLETEADHCYECFDQNSEEVFNSFNKDKSILPLITPKFSLEKNFKALKEHIILITNEAGIPLYHCTVCSKTFKCRSQQYYHLGCASQDQKKYRCEECDKSFANKSHYRYHKESHKESLHKCSKCEKIFKNSLVLQKHEKLHDSNPIQCSECNKTFRRKESLKAHILQHKHDALPYPCSICEKTYSTKSNLQQHMVKHSDKRFECHMCGKHFQRNSTLKLHLKKHQKTELFLCVKCKKHFSDAATLLRHSKHHEESNKYHCSFCDITTVRKDNMLRHVRNIHPGESFDSFVQIIKPPFISDQDKKGEVNGGLDIANHVDERDFDAIDFGADQNLKTVENSSVIKCIGNVQPVKIPSIQTKDSVAPPRPVEEYDPIQLYRKILTLGNDDDDEESYDGHDSFNEISQANQEKDQENYSTINSLNNQQSRSSYCWNNFSEMHWRKNFMNTYEIDGDKLNK